VTNATVINTLGKLTDKGRSQKNLRRGSKSTSQVKNLVWRRGGQEEAAEHALGECLKSAWDSGGKTQES